MAANKSYRVVNIEILTSPCRKCSEAICNRTTCAKLIAFQARCDQELPSYGVCDFDDEFSSPVKSSFSSGCTEDETPDLAADAAETENEVAGKPERKPKAEPKAKRKPVQNFEPKPEPKPEPEPVAAEPLIPVDMTIEQIFPPARMAQLANTQFTQLSLF